MKVTWNTRNIGKNGTRKPQLRSAVGLLCVLYWRKQQQSEIYLEKIAGGIKAWYEFVIVKKLHRFTSKGTSELFSGPETDSTPVYF
jgi:hypothetical protein